MAVSWSDNIQSIRDAIEALGYTTVYGTIDEYIEQSAARPTFVSVYDDSIGVGIEGDDLDSVALTYRYIIGVYAKSPTGRDDARAIVDAILATLHGTVIDVGVCYVISVSQLQGSRNEGAYSIELEHRQTEDY